MKHVLFLAIFILVGCGKSSDDPAAAEAPAIVRCEYVKSENVQVCGSFSGCQEITQNEYACDVKTEDEDYSCVVLENEASGKLVSNECVRFGFSSIQWPEDKPN